MDFLTVLLGVFVLSYGALALIIWRRPLVGRIAIRVLLAVGFFRLQIPAGMLIETALVATAGLVVGLAVAIWLGGPLLTPLSPKSQVSLDYSNILLTVGFVYAAVLLVTLLPALRAARLRPAEALRGVG